jgi:hypothetical protein
MDERGQRVDRGLARRELMWRTLKTGAYAAPVILSATVPVLSVAAVTPLPTTAIQDAVLYGVGHGATFDVLFSLNTGPSGLLGQITADNFGVAGGVFAFPPSVTSLTGVSTVTLTYFLNVGGVRASSPAAPPFTSGLVGLMNGNATAVLARVLQIPLGCPTPTQYSEYVDVAIVNGRPSTTYSISVQPNTLGAPVQITSVTTSAQGHVTAYVPAAVTSPGGTAPTNVVVTATPVGGGATLSVNVVPGGGSSALTTLSCTDVASASGAVAIGLAQR